MTAEPRRGWYRPSTFEVAVGWLYGIDDGAVVGGHVSEHPRAALRDVLRHELVEGPCVIPFSGGRDSSLVLAVACDVAREAGVDLPTALTYRYPGLLEAEESAWQELVMTHLARQGMEPAWIRRDVTDEFDVVGPLISPYLERHGHALWPPNIAPSIAAAREAGGATVLTGEHGDEVFGVRRATLLAGVVRRRGRGLTGADLRGIAAAATPGFVRAAAARVAGHPPSWLNKAGQARWRRLTAHAQLTTPLRWDRAVRQSVASRSASLGNDVLRAIAQEHGTKDVAPLAAPHFIAAFAHYGGAAGVASRGTAVRLLAGDLLPLELTNRRTKAYFNGSVFHRHSHDVFERWRSVGQAEEWVDSARLRELWAAGRPSMGTSSLVQAAWLNLHGQAA